MRRLIPLLVAMLALTGLAACGSTDSSTSGSAHNDADVTFAQSMIPHHQQAVLMARMASTQGESPQVKQLAADIEAAQGPEIKTMTGWLDAWGEKSNAMSGMNGMDDMPGMMSDDDLGTLEASSGAAWDQLFLAMMIAHHTGAIEMAKTEQADGENADAIALATKIEAAQTQEIAAMKALLAT